MLYTRSFNQRTRAGEATICPLSGSSVSGTQVYYAVVREWKARLRSLLVFIMKITRHAIVSAIIAVDGNGRCDSSVP